MNTITVTRKRSLFSGLMPYWIIVSEMTKEEFMSGHGFEGDLCEQSDAGMPAARITVEELDRTGIRILNGETREVPVKDGAVSVFLSTMDGSLSNEILIRNIPDNRLTVVTKGGFRTISCPHIEI